MRSGSDSSIIF